MAEDAPLTILFTDVEGSTDLRRQRGDSAAHEILRAHEELVRGCVAAHGGREVKSLGDGFMIAFTSARPGLACAVAIQEATEKQRWRSLGATVRVRVGVNTGEVTEEGDDLYGQAVNAAARIAGRAKAGEILVAEVTKQLVGSSPEFDSTNWHGQHHRTGRRGREAPLGGPHTSAGTRSGPTSADSSTRSWRGRVPW